MENVGSVHRWPNYEIEPGSIRESPEIPVSRKQRNVAIYAALGQSGHRQSVPFRRFANTFARNAPARSQ